MSDFFSVLLVIVALAAVGNFAAKPSVVSGNKCAGQYVQLCW